RAGRIVEAIVAPVFRLERRVDLGDPAHPRVLAVSSPDRGDGGLLDEVGAVEIRETLREVDGAVLHRQARHLREDRRDETLEPPGHRGAHVLIIPAAKRRPERRRIYRRGCLAYPAAPGEVSGLRFQDRLLKLET